MKVLVPFVGSVLLLFVVVVRGASIDYRNAHDLILEINERATNEKQGENADEIINRVNEKNDLDLVEGDMILPKNTNTMEKRGALRYGGRWPNAEVPYEFNSNLPQDYRDKVIQTMETYHTSTCVRFRPKTASDTNYIQIAKNRGCSSSVGMVGGRQTVSIGSGCDNHGIIFHELMHALGFKHEQSRSDRDQNVRINWDNIKDGKENNFNKEAESQILEHKQYDFGSVMHYGKTAFSRNGAPTIEAIWNPDESMGQRNGPSDLDLVEINAIYNCVGGEQVLISQWSEWSPCIRSSCTKTRQRTCSKPNDATQCPNTDSSGIETETMDCTDAECSAPIDGNWGPWNPVTSCDASCGPGTTTRTRQCNNPPASHGGSACSGSGSETVQCEMHSCAIGEYDVDFEGLSGFRSWHNEGNEWIIVSGSTPSGCTGPNGGANGSPKYAYFEATGRDKNAKGVILSPRLSATNAGATIEFYYHMRGTSEMGTLEIEIKRTGSNWMNIFTKTGNQGNNWHKEEVHLGLDSGEGFEIRITATRGDTYCSDIAIDDVSFKNTGPYVANVFAPSRGNLDFEDNSFGTWTNAPNDDFDWTIRSGSTPSTYTGPAGGANGSAKYAYFETSYPARSGKRAILLSAELTASGTSTTMQFSYSMYGNTMGTLEIAIKRRGSSSFVKIFTKSGDQGQAWHEETLNLGVLQGELFQIEIIAIRGSSYRSDIAIDNIQFS